MRSETLHDINIDITINSGQVFLWHSDGHVWQGVDGANVISVDADSAIYLDKNTDFFRQTDDIAVILSDIGADGRVCDSIRKNRGLRILRQDPFQCAVSFVVSSNSSIANIRRSLIRLCDRFGRNVHHGGCNKKLFPEPKKLAGATISGLLSCGLGYRAKYVREMARRVADGSLDLQSLRGASYSEAKEELLAVPGIGYKVADCIMLFSLDILEAFPLDRWMLRALDHYDTFDIPKTLTPKRYTELHDDIVEYFGEYAGYAQQYLFRSERDAKNMRWL